jgi:hypothetical protein
MVEGRVRPVRAGGSSQQRRSPECSRRTPRLTRRTTSCSSNLIGPALPTLNSVTWRRLVLGVQTRPQDDALPPIGGIPERREQRHSSKPCQLAGFLNPKRESQERQLRPVALAREPVPMTRDRQRENPRHNSTEQRLPSGRGRSGSWSLLRLDRPRRARGSGEVFDRLDLPRLEHAPANLEPIGEDDQFAFELTAVLEDDEHDPVVLRE